MSVYGKAELQGRCEQRVPARVADGAAQDATEEGLKMPTFVLPPQDSVDECQQRLEGQLKRLFLGTS